VVVPVAQLPLKDNKAIHKFKLLAGVRWTLHPPKDAGLGPDETGREHGYFKISCDDFPEPAQNLKWASDMIDKLVEEAIVRSAVFWLSLR
jgi:small subunit ribosomal protein S35